MTMRRALAHVDLDRGLGFVLRTAAGFQRG